MEQSDDHIQEDIEVKQVLLSPKTPDSNNDALVSDTTPQNIDSEVKKLGPNCKAKPKKSPYLVIISAKNLQITTTVIQDKSRNRTATPDTKVKKTCKKDNPVPTPKGKPTVKLKMSPQYLTLRSRKLVRKSFSKKAYPKKRELRPLLPKPCTSPPAFTEINRDNTWQSIGAVPQPLSSTFVTVVTDTLQITNEQSSKDDNSVSVTEKFDTIDKELVSEMLPDIQPQNIPVVLTQNREIKTIPTPVQKDKQPTLELIQGYEYKNKTSANNCAPVPVVAKNPPVPVIAENPPSFQVS